MNCNVCSKQIKEITCADCSNELEEQAIGDKKIYEYSMDCGRMGSVDGTFVASKAKIDAAIGKKLYFGEILGKYSEITGVLKESDLKILPVPAAFVELFTKHVGNTGYNPLDYIMYACGNDEECYHEGGICDNDKCDCHVDD